MKYFNWSSEKNLILKRERSRFARKNFEPLDEEEKDIMESIEKEEWKPVKNFEREKKSAIQAARNTLKKDKRINLRLSQKDYHQIILRAIEEGIPYQTLVASIVHKYLNGMLLPKYHEKKTRKSSI